MSAANKNQKQNDNSNFKEKPRTSGQTQKDIIPAKDKSPDDLEILE